jgi:hypothetical protein
LLYHHLQKKEKQTQTQTQTQNQKKRKSTCTCALLYYIPFDIVYHISIMYL